MVNYGQKSVFHRQVFSACCASHLLRSTRVDFLCCWRQASLSVNVPSNKAMNITGQIICDW